MEREAAQRLSILLKESKSLHDQRFASDLEWLLTWKLKTDCCSELMWCDGVIFENIEYIGKISQLEKLSITLQIKIGKL